MSEAQISLSVAQFMARAREIADVDIEDAAAVEPLMVLHHSLTTEAQFDEEGARAHERKLLRLLANRLRMLRDFRQHTEIAEQEVAGPLVIMGVARSGTTKLQKLLAASGDFNFLTFWQNYNWASRTGAPGEDVASRIAEAEEFCTWIADRSPEYRLGHHFEALEPEEEGPLSEGCLVAPSFIGYAELPSYARWMAAQPRSIFFTFLRDVLKYLQWQGLAEPGRPWLLKSPNYNGQEQMLRSVFPDARFVVAHRSPLQTMPSMCKLVSCFRKAFGGPDVDYGLIVEGNFANMAAHLANRQNDPSLPFLDLRFEDIVKGPDAVAGPIYHHAGMTLSDDARSRMIDWDTGNRMHKHGRFEYSLAEAGLDEAMIRKQMADYFTFLNAL